jgi:hypothetical protein
LTTSIEVGYNHYRIIHTTHDIGVCQIYAVKMGGVKNQ